MRADADESRDRGKPARVGRTLPAGAGIRQWGQCCDGRCRTADARSRVRPATDYAQR